MSKLEDLKPVKKMCRYVKRFLGAIGFIDLQIEKEEPAKKTKGLQPP